MQITVTVPENKAEAFLELVKELGYKSKLKTSKTKEPKLLKELRQSWKEVQMHERGEIELKTLDQVLNEL
ncbi:hypothetical protein [Runella sp.]|jgi:hypothetical protein|uniref:hypothetical protein n=1 Tax=Runella sp. TaxID=1960881 RepID=UPI002624DD97|nr:hypothetical protein [Runella sp.]